MQSEKEIREQMCGIGRRVYERGMAAANDGNFSVKISNHEILCTPTGVSKGFMTPEMMCRIDENGNLLEASGGYRPSSEMKMHLRVYQRRPDIKAVVHAHPPYATTFAAAGLPLDKPILTEAVVSLGTVPVTEFAAPSTDEVPDSLEPFLADYDAVLLASHGALTYSDTLEAAYLKMESVEFYARILWQTMLIGGAEGFNDEQMEKLNEVRRKMKTR